MINESNMKKIVVFLLVLIFSACNKMPDITDDMLDGMVIFDPSINNKEAYLVSYAIPNPTSEQAATPVVIACHGYTATTFEWEEFRNWAGGRNDFYISLVLLGGHGSTYQEFKNSSWRDWKTSIVEEYNRLKQAGFTNISLVGSSTSCALILELLSSGYFKGTNTPQNIFFVDPIVISSNKLLSIVGVVGPVIGFTEEDQTPEEDRVWYHFRPQETLRELQSLLTIVRKALENGINLPAGTYLKVYKSKKDPTADPVSAVLIYKGMKTANGMPIDVQMIDSELHVFTRLNLRKSVTQQDRANQLAVFNEIVEKVLE
jgi:carboxylesterase